MFGYLPAAYFYLWPFTVLLPKPIGLFAFIATNISAAILSIWLIRKLWCQPDQKGTKELFVWPLLIAVAHFQHVLQANQFTLMLLALCLGGLALIMKRRDAAGGFLLGLAACLKVTPIVFAAFLVLRKQWTALAGMIVAIIVANVLPSLLVFGADGTIREHKAWLGRVDAYSNKRFIEDPWLRVKRHRGNCSLAIVLSRWLQEPPNADTQVVLRGNVPAEVITDMRAKLQPNEHLTIDPMPELDRPWSLERVDLSNMEKYPRFHALSLSANSIRTIWWVVAVSAGIMIIATTWRSRRVPVDSPVFAALAALWLGAMLLPSPMMRDYYLALVFPALIVAGNLLTTASPHRIIRRHAIDRLRAVRCVDRRRRLPRKQHRELVWRAPADIGFCPIECLGRLATHPFFRGLAK